LLPIKEKNVAAYKKVATSAGKVFVKHGALKYREYVMSDPNAMGVLEFPEALKLKSGKTVIYAAVSLNPRRTATRQ